jgi:FkbM family methyltransferase
MRPDNVIPLITPLREVMAFTDCRDKSRIVAGKRLTGLCAVGGRRYLALTSPGDLPVKLRSIETWLRRARVKTFKALGSTRRGRKLLLDFLPANVSEVTVECGDHRITVSPHEMIGRHVVATGGFTRDSVRHVLDELDRRRLLPQKGGCALEVGANIGTHTLYLALTGRFDRIVAVEPDPRNLRFLRRNVDDNGFGHLVRIMEGAAGEAEAELRLHRIEGNFGNSSFVHARPTDSGVVVPVRPVDAILRDAGIAADEVSLVWMDIEGFEPQAFRSMGPLLARQVPVYLEFSPEFYGRDGTAAFVRFIGQYYNECIVTTREGQQTIAVGQLAGQMRQCDVLLLPDAAAG